MLLNNNFQEQIFFATIRITIEDKINNGSSIGTGFIIKVSLGDQKKRNVILLISNKHVYINHTNLIQLNFHKAKSDEFSPKLGEQITITKERFSDIYYEHPNKDIDLACLNISEILEQNNIYFRNLLPSMFADFEKEELLPGNDVLFIGYPQNRFDNINNLPLLRKGYVSSIPKVDFNGKKEFIIDAQVYPGSSGSPVFSVINGHFKLIGIVTQTMIKHEIIQSVPTVSHYAVHQVLGLGIVQKTELIQELIDETTKIINEQLNSEI